MEEKIQEAVKFFNDKFGLKKEVKSGEISFPKCRSSSSDTDLYRDRKSTL